MNLQGFTLRVLDPETAEVTPGAPGVTINSDIRVERGESVSIGRVPDVVDDEGERVAGTFEGGTSLDSRRETRSHSSTLAAPSPRPSPSEAHRAIRR